MSKPKTAAEAYLTSLLNKILLVTTSDTRMFRGVFKCTDTDRNLILAQAYEYRLPPTPFPSLTPRDDNAAIRQQKVTLDLTSRYLGLVVVPGEHIMKIEVEEFASQTKDGESKWLLPLDEYEPKEENI